MFTKFERWAIKHLTFECFLKVDPFAQKLTRGVLWLKYFIFTRGKTGSFLQGTLKPKIQQVFENALFTSVPYLAILLVLAILPSIMPRSLAQSIAFSGDTSIAVGLMTAMLTVAGVFLTLFYTSATTVLANKYPNGNALISQLFVQSALSNGDLRYCNSFIVVSIAFFFLIAFGQINSVLIVYVTILSIVLIIKLPKVLKLSTQASDIRAIASIPANRFLSLAQAASYDHAFHKSDWLATNFNRMAKAEVHNLQLIMDYASGAGDYKRAYSNSVAEAVIETLIKYASISTRIPIDSKWHLTSSAHKSWFMSDSSEVQIAMHTGTIPMPKSAPDRLGFHKELLKIIEQHQINILGEQAFEETTNWLLLMQSTLEPCVTIGDTRFITEEISPLLLDALNTILELKVGSTNNIQKKCLLLEHCTRSLIEVTTSLTRLLKKTDPEEFLFTRFVAFSQKEVQLKGFPLGLNSRLIALSKKLEYECCVFECVETPEWYFNEAVQNLYAEELRNISNYIATMYEDFFNQLAATIKKDKPSSFILVLKEAELFDKSKRLLDFTEARSRQINSNAEAIAILLEKIEEQHNELIDSYPTITIAYYQENEELRKSFPDIYGFVFFNYCERLHNLILTSKLNDFSDAMPALFQLMTLSELNLQKELKEIDANDIRKAQILSEPTLIFFELCGMAYCMAELQEDYDLRRTIEENIAAITAKFPELANRWRLCLDLAEDYAISSKTFMDLFNWRRAFIDYVDSSGLYPDIPQYPFFRNSMKLTTHEKRIVKMLPVGFNEYGDFNGTEIFKEFLLPKAVGNEQ